LVGNVTTHANSSAITALLISPFDDSTIISTTSFVGGFSVVDAKLLVSIAWRALVMSVGAIGLNAMRVT
jgi:hypothetical protein